MLQIVDGHEVYVVDIPYRPALPIVPSTKDEVPYAHALTLAFQNNVITNIMLPGKFAIELDMESLSYKIFKVQE